MRSKPAMGSSRTGEMSPASIIRAGRTRAIPWLMGEGANSTNPSPSWRHKDMPWRPFEQQPGSRSSSGIRREQPAFVLEADELQQRIEDRFWRDDLGTFALAIGDDGWVADTVSSNPGHLLWAEAVRPERAAEVAKSLTGEGLWSGWGIRTLTRDNPAYHPVSYHRGSVWPHDTMLAVAGLISYGHVDEALTLVGGLLAVSPHFSYELPELFSGNLSGRSPPPRRLSNELRHRKRGRRRCRST